MLKGSHFQHIMHLFTEIFLPKEAIAKSTECPTPRFGSFCTAVSQTEVMHSSQQGHAMACPNAVHLRNAYIVVGTCHGMSADATLSLA